MSREEMHIKIGEMKSDFDTLKGFTPMDIPIKAKDGIVEILKKKRWKEKC